MVRLDPAVLASGSTGKSVGRSGACAGNAVSQYCASSWRIAELAELAGFAEFAYLVSFSAQVVKAVVFRDRRAGWSDRRWARRVSRSSSRMRQETPSTTR